MQQRTEGSVILIAGLVVGCACALIAGRYIAGPSPDKKRYGRHTLDI
jgi:uncharacterized membrane protein YdjX (TVP38/TMEM64 family)